MPESRVEATLPHKEMNMQKRLLRHLTVAVFMATGPTLAQQPAPPPAPASAPAQPAAAGAKTFSQQDLDTLLAPIALYPDALLAQILMASTYPLEIVEAARWVKANPGLKDKALQDAMEKQAWDPSVKALSAVPKVLEQMNEKLDWTQKLGDAFLAQQTEMMATVQQLRTKAAAAGNLKSTPEVAVKTEKTENKTVYVIESAKPEVVYVPTYNPSTIYGSWWYPAPPYYMYPPAYVYPPGLAFATGVVVGAAIWGNVNWGNNNVNINVNQYNNFNKTNIQNSNFQHNAEHRKGVAYKDQGVANQHNRGTNAQTSQARSQYQGRADSQPRASTTGGGASQGQPRASNYGGGGSDRASPSQSSAGSRGGGGGGGFSGAGSGASTRAASSRGGASRGGGGGGGRRR
jgi:uncharacterized protein DUF3300